MVERATFPRDTLSTHIFEADALVFLDRLGVTDALRATGAPFISRLNVRTEDLCFACRMAATGGRRRRSAFDPASVLDPILLQAAEESGAQVRMATAVTGLVQDGGRVTGVRMSSQRPRGRTAGAPCRRRRRA